MWSIYDTFLLLTGVITAVIAVLPMPGIPTKTRATSGVVGGGLILLALYLGSLSSFTYPSLVFLGPVVALAAAGVVVADARKRLSPQVSLQFDESAHGRSSSPAPVPVPAAPLGGELVADLSVPLAVPSPAAFEATPQTVVERVAEPLLREAVSGSTSDPRPHVPTEDVRSEAWAQAHHPDTPAARLAEIVTEYPEFGPAVRNHPNCYPELRAWIDEFVGGRARG